MFDGLPELPVERRWRRQDRPVIGVITLIRRQQPDGQGAPQPSYLLIKRRHAPYAGKWALIGGKVEFGEQLSTAAVREVNEETGLDSTFMALRGVVNERLAPVGPYDEGGHFLLFVCAMDAPHGTPEEQMEGPLAWFTRPEVETLHRDQAIIPSDYAMLCQFTGDNPSLPYYEAEMIAASAGNAGAASPPRLSRFQRIG